MNLKSLLTDEDAVSPVIGVILMVAITVILAAVIGAFVLGIGSSQEKAPQATLNFDYDKSNGGWADGDSFKIKHSGGESISLSQLTLKYGGTEVGTSSSVLDDTEPSGDTWTAGESWDVVEKNPGDGTADISSDTTVTITWTGESGDSTQILAEDTTP